MKRSDDAPLFLAVSGEGENASVVTTLRAARAWLCRQFYGVEDPPLHEERYASDRRAEEARWQSLIEPANWSTCSDGLEYEYAGGEDNGATVRAFFVTEVPASVEEVADAIDAARYQHPDHPRERPRSFSEADIADREYALRLARAARRRISSW